MCEGRQAKCSPDAGPGIPAPLSVSSPSSEPHWGHSSGAESSCPHRMHCCICASLPPTRQAGKPGRGRLPRVTCAINGEFGLDDVGHGAAPAAAATHGEMDVDALVCELSRVWLGASCSVVFSADRTLGMPPS